jgi:hypothetical protein
MHILTLVLLWWNYKNTNNLSIPAKKHYKLIRKMNMLINILGKAINKKEIINKQLNIIKKHCK